ncbi:MAG: polysaccharide deacetylase family protein, partial [Pseudomonadota bacterium]|nr:polysaccharide deacetylase family protein [Pseudomonadota bacterium]
PGRFPHSTVLRLRAVALVSLGSLCAAGVCSHILCFRERPPPFLAIFAPGVTYFLETAVPAAALTIDDGPDPEETPAILDVLRDHDAHATFFLIGSRIQGNEPLLATCEDVDDPQTLQPNRLIAEQVHANPRSRFRSAAILCEG